jgi:membrane protease YdiL (CAAX protease family)
MSAAEIGEPRAERLRLGLQIGLSYGMLEGALWTSGRVQVAFSTAGVAALLLTTLRERRFWPNLGIGLQAVTRALWFIPVAAGVAGLILLGAWSVHTLHPPSHPALAALQGLQYLLWALAQQFILESFLFTRLECLFGGRAAVLGAALLFAIAHIPNPVLVPVTWVGGLILCELFRRYRTIYVPALAHALVALSLSISVPESILHHMRVGIVYFLR